MMAQASVTNLQTQLTAISTGGGSRATYVGASSTTSNGELYPTVNGALDTSVAGAVGGSKICSVTYAGSHVCSPYELYESVVTGTGKLDGTTDVGPLQVYQQAWVNGYSTGATGPVSKDRFGGLSENCAGGTYLTGDSGWKNTTFKFAIAPGAAAGSPRVLQFDSTVGCNTPYALACCK